MRHSLRSLALLSSFTLTACATAELTESGRLTSYAGLKPSNGVMTKTKVKADKPALLAARTVRIVPTAVGDAAAASGLTKAQLRLVSNVIDRALCRELSRRYEIVAGDGPADLVVEAAITRITKTDKTAAGASVATSMGATVAGAATGLPVPAVRLPLGLGALSVEGEARRADGAQVAGYVWARGADVMTTKPRVAEEADAHSLAGTFAADFAKLLLTGEDPVASPMPLLPSAQTIGEYFGNDPKYAACRQFGKDPGLNQTLGDVIGLPPAWTDKGAP